MAYRRTLSLRVGTVARRYTPSFSYVLSEDNHRNERQSLDFDFSLRDENQYVERRYLGNLFEASGFSAFRQNTRQRPFSLNLAAASSFCRYMSTSIDEGSDKMELITDVAEILSDTTVQVAASKAASVNEVAIAAADSFLPVKGLQYLIDAVHSFTGLNWWASIAITTILIRGATLPLLINQLKATAKLTLLRPHLEALKQNMQDNSMDPTAITEARQQMQRLFKEYGVSPLTPLKGLFLQGPLFVCFFLAISNMTEKVPSFKTGGAYWFLDLSTPDTFYVLPVLTALTFLITVECNMQEGMEGNPMADTMKKISRGFAVATVPLTMTFPKAIFCYWITSNLFSLAYGFALKVPGVKKSLGVPEIPLTQQNTDSGRGLSLFSSQKQATAADDQTASSGGKEKLGDRRVSSSSIISQRLRSLEKQVKGRKKRKRGGEIVVK